MTMQIACRWPGGHNMVVPRPDAPPMVIHLNGPVGESVLLKPINMARPPSADVATLAQKRVADTVRRMQDSAGNQFGPSDYGGTGVSGQFGNEWDAQDKDFD